MKLSQIKENLLIEEEVTQNIITEIDTISDPSILLMGIFGMIIDNFLLGIMIDLYFGNRNFYIF